jgi:protein-disulfide isomerase
MNSCAQRWPAWVPQSSEIEALLRIRDPAPPLPGQPFRVSEQASFQVIARPGVRALIITRRAFTAALTLTGLAAWSGLLPPLRLINAAMAQSASDVAKPVSLPDMALGPADAKVTITEFASMTCPHCAAFNAEVFPKIKSEYIEPGKIRYVFREFPLDVKATAGSMLARCIANGDAGKYFAVVDLLFRQQGDWVMKNTTDTLIRIGKQAGFSQEQVENCLKDQDLLNKIAADQKYATEVLKVDSTPTFFINGERIRGEASFDEFRKKIDPLLGESQAENKDGSQAAKKDDSQAAKDEPAHAQ